MHGAVGAVMRSFVQIVQIAALAGILAIAACSDANMHGQTQAEGVAADVKKSPAIITVKGGPVAVPRGSGTIAKGTAETVAFVGRIPVRRIRRITKIHTRTTASSGTGQPAGRDGRGPEFRQTRKGRTGIRQVGSRARRIRTRT
jgi:hypothetical protein